MTSWKRRISRRCGANVANAGGSGECGPRNDKMCVTPAEEYLPSSGMPQMVMRGAVRLVLIGVLSHWQAREIFGRINPSRLALDGLTQNWRFEKGHEDPFP